MASIHLLVLVHGMWGNPAHLAHMDKIIREVKGSTESAGPDGARLAVLVACTNSDESTYDGVDWGGERVAQEVRYLYLCFSFDVFPTSHRSWRKSRRTRTKERKSLASQ